MKIAFLYLIFEFLFYLLFQFCTASLVAYGLINERQLDPHFSSYISSGAYVTRIFLLLDRIISLQLFTQFLLVWVFVKLDLLKHFFVVFALVFLSFGHFILLGFDIYVYQLSTLFLPGNYPNLMDKPGQYPFMYVGYVILASNFFALFAVTKLTKQRGKIAEEKPKNRDRPRLTINRAEHKVLQMMSMIRNSSRELDRHTAGMKI